MTDKRTLAFQLIMMVDHLPDEEFAPRVRQIIKTWLKENRENRARGVQQAIETADTCKPVEIDGIKYRSINEACRESGRSYGYVRARV